MESGLVASLNRPGGNVTGVSLFNVELVGKQMEVLHRALPGVTRVAILLNDKNMELVARPLSEIAVAAGF